jgi:peptide-methionine (S)-S-oxide reductase
VSDVITLGGGCFWCIEAVFTRLRGVEKVVSGYSGGRVPHPTYEQVCTGQTGHAEVVEVTYDPAVISTEDLLKVFFTLHDPTTKDQQGNDHGPQYRSVVFYRNQAQKAAAERAVEEIDASGAWGRPAVTEIKPFEAFYPAEDYHQDYYRNNPMQPYCLIVIRPKVAKLKKLYLDKLKKGD